ncbi:hypothetical protein [Thalassobius vesicularis]|uniref:hypothetical protein n=1 Tax=Thalassobius vesicularis TaxID=1294297 RepID=UPI001FED0050|nr:hypothetical protein [Thalassobius vesicularis]
MFSDYSMGELTAIFAMQGIAGLILFSGYYFVAMILALIASGALGMLVEWALIRHLYKRPLDTRRATWGLSLILQQIYRSVFGACEVGVTIPEWTMGSTGPTAGQLCIVDTFLVVIFAVFPLLLDTFRLNLSAKYLTYAFVAIGLVLCWGAIAWRCSSSSRPRPLRTRKSSPPPASLPAWPDLGRRHVHQVPPRPRREIRRPHSHRPDRLPAQPQDAGHVERP